MKDAPTREDRIGAEDEASHTPTTQRMASLPDPATDPKPEDLSPDTGGALDFLAHWDPRGPWVLTSIVPDGGKTQTETFSPGQESQLTAWIDERQGHQNIYFMVNPALRALRSKAKKKNVRAGCALHVDVDPRTGEDIHAERARILAALRGYDPAPSVILDSGGGYQAFWMLDEEYPIGGDEERAKVFEAYILKVELDLEADSCHNIDRIMRLPGTVNVPGERKRRKGRVARVAYVVEAHWDRRYALNRFEPVERHPVVSSKPNGAGATVPANLPKVDLDALPVSDRCRMLIVQGDDPDDPTRYPSRSEALFAILCEMVRCGVDDDVMAAVILNPDFGISGNVLDQPKPQDYAARQIARAREESDDAFICDEKDRPIPNSQHNIRVALRRLAVTLRYDKFAERELIEGLEGFGPALDDPASVRLRLEIDQRFGFRPTKDFFHDVLNDHARRNAYHPVVEHLASLAWDGVPRIGRWLIEYGGADDTPYTRAVGELVLVAAVRRVRRPGVKFDEMLVLESEQGTNKSTALKVLAGRDEWFSDDLPLNADTKRVIEALSGKWIVEAGELKGLKKGDVEHLKGFLSRTHDKARMAYDRREREVARQSVIVGTTNDSQYLRDVTGNRRFWPVQVSGFDIDRLRRDRDQLWAEAAAREAEGAPIRLDPSLWDAAAAEQDRRRVEDPFYEVLMAMLGTEIEGKIAARDVWTIVGKPTGNRTQDDNERLGSAMRRLGFEAKQRRFGRGPESAYVRGNDPRRIALEMGPDGNVVDVFHTDGRDPEPFERPGD